MAKLNDKIITADKQIRKDAMKHCGVYLQACLPEKELENLYEDWMKTGGREVIPWWQFVFDNVKVSYHSNE